MLAQNFLRCVMRSTGLRTFCSETPARTVTSLEKSLNRVTLLGRVGIDPQLRGNSSTPVVLFTVATNHNYRFESGEIQQKTEWHRVSVFKPYLRNTLVEYLKRGQRVLVDGRLVYGEVVDSRGHTYITATVVASDVIIMSGVASKAEKEEKIEKEEVSEDMKELDHIP